MIDYRRTTRPDLGTAVGTPDVRRTGGAVAMGARRRFSGPQFADGRGRSVSISAGSDVRCASLSAFSPFLEIAPAGVLATGAAINLSTDRNETSADRAQSGARAWSPPD